MFIDGVYRPRAGMALTDLGPLDRIEVLRGPQGTLFGRNTSAGLISIITAKPRFTPEISGADRRRQLQLLAASQASVTGPLSDTDRRTSRRGMGQARRLPQGRHFRPRPQ